MEIQQLSRDDAVNLCTKTEGHFFDRKQLGIASVKVEKAAVAFSNSDGGEVVIGILNDHDVSNPTGCWEGATKPEDFNSIIQAIVNLSPSLPFTAGFYTSRDLPGIILILRFEKSTNLHNTSDGTVYVRKGAQSLPIKDQEKIAALKYAKGVNSFEEEKLKDVPPEVIEKSNALREFLQHFSPKTDPLSYLVNEHLLDQKTWDPRYCAALLFHDYPASALPRKCSVKIIRYETKEEDPERDHLKETIPIEGHLYKLINDSIENINRILQSVKIWTVDGLTPVTYPVETLWEIFVNAIIHRDYSISDDVHVLIYDDRIEVKSPGKFPGHITPKNILEERYTRNTKIVRTLSRYPNAPNKDIGEGLNTAFQKMQEWKLQNPKLEERDNYVVVTIPHTPIARPEELVLDFLAKHSQITNRQARDLTAIRSENQMKNVFYKLRDQDIIEAVPELKGPKAAWRKKK